MSRRLFWILPAAMLVAAVAGPRQSPAQQPVSRGFDIRADSAASGEERANQRELWVLEVHCKLMRMIEVPVTDPKTGEKKPETVWYMVYKAINRPIEQTSDTKDAKPVNVLDKPPYERPIFVPEFTLVTDDNGIQRIYPDEILPEAQAAIMARERQLLKNSVQIVAEIPPETPFGSPDEQATYGVVTWRGVHPETDYFSVYMSGFSNAYRVGQDADGKPLVLRKTIMQKYWRPGDEFRKDEREFRLQGDPQWIYRADEPLAAEPQAPASSE